MARGAGDPSLLVSWAAHDLEPYLLRAKLGARISIPFCLAGSYSPDILTKWAVYGFGFARHRQLVSDPVQLHRGWPGLGFTHTLFFGIVISSLIFWRSNSRLWAWSFLIGAFAHVLSDTLDSVGVMILFPFSTWHLHLGLWEYVGQAGRARDAVAYYTSFGGVWDVFWAGWLILHWRVLTTSYFRDEVVPSDPFWPWLAGKTNQFVMLTFYRASAFFGIVAIVGWYAWALLVNDFHPHLDWTVGGPQWAPRQGPP
jgi:membrane-bound metal-dependent hydrolase YbcI (DUF457 family)